MGSCMSSKSGSKKVRYTTVPLPYTTKLQIQHGYLPMTDKKQNEARRSGPYSRGQSTLFGFKRRPASVPAVDNAAQQRKTCSQESLQDDSAGTSPRAPRANSAAPAPKVNRFGFKAPVPATSNKVSDSNANIPEFNVNKTRPKAGGKIAKPVKPAAKPATVAAQSPTAVSTESIGPGRFTLQTSLLPAPQFPIRLASAEQERRTKGAKTLANNTAKNLHGSDSSSNGSLNADSGIGSQRSAETDVEIAMLDASPGSANRRNKRQQAMRKRELEVVLSGKSFDVRDLKDDLNVITEISVISLPATNPKPALRVAPQPTHNKTLKPGVQPNTGMVRQRKLMYQQRTGTNTTSATARHNNRMSEKEQEECTREKEEEECYNDWGPGEAMAEEFSLQEDGTKISNVQPRPIHLAIEEARFAAIAAGESSLIEDERSPVDSLISNSPPSSESSEIKPDNGDKNKASPDSPDSPTNASNSLSLSEGRDRDFLIDDEIADQPGLMFDEEVDLGSSLGLVQTDCLVTESSCTLVQSPPAPPAPVHVPPATEGLNKCSRTNSVDTLSPCESIASDDLMMDFDRSDQSAFNASRVCSQLPMQDTQQVFREWSNLLARQDDRGSLSGRSPRALRSRPTSTPDSPRSLRTSPASSNGSPMRAPASPLRPPRHDDEHASYVWLDRTSYQQMCQDIVSMKTMLLKLKRLFQENDENNVIRAETLNPFDSTLKNGFFSLAGGEDLDAGRSTEVSIQEEVVELRRQAVFQQQQLDDRERTVKLLQLQMTKYTNSQAVEVDKESCNAATQTERIRPVSAGPSLLQSLPTDASNGPLVSMSDGWRQRKVTRRLSSPTPRRLASNIPTLNGVDKS